jgi:hypothetical protein
MRGERGERIPVTAVDEEGEREFLFLYFCRESFRCRRFRM